MIRIDFFFNFDFQIFLYELYNFKVRKCKNKKCKVEEYINMGVMGYKGRFFYIGEIYQVIKLDKDNFWS